MSDPENVNASVSFDEGIMTISYDGEVLFTGDLRQGLIVHTVLEHFLVKEREETSRKLTGDVFNVASDN